MNQEEKAGSSNLGRADDPAIQTMTTMFFYCKHLKYYK